MKPPVTRFLLRSLACLAISPLLQAATTSLATSPLVTSASSSVKPNLLFILDDSGSMDSDYSPDWVTNDISNKTIDNYPYLRNNSHYNGIYYNPAITYSPPVFYKTDGTLDTTTYPSMSGESTTTGGDSSASSTARNWNAVPKDAYGMQSSTKTVLTNRAHYWFSLPGEFCKKKDLRECNTQSAASALYSVPATLRWCNSTALSTCKATWRSSGTASLNFAFPRIAAPANRAWISFSSWGSASITGIAVGGVQILSSATTASNDTNEIATRVAENINACANTTTGSCGASGYKAIVSGSSVLVVAPGTTTSTPVVSKSGSVTVTPSAFNSEPIYSGTTAPGTNRLTVIHSNQSTGYVYPGTSVKADTRSDCAGTTCTYNEEMTNYANWWAYYRTRMQLMKTATSRSFSAIDSRYRVGFLTISNNYSASKFSNLDEFNPTNKRSWYSTLFAALPQSWTPLRAALSRAGRLYAGMLNGQKINGTTVIDPMQYSCQQNFTILSTDGYWNTNEENTTYGPYIVNANTNVGNTDGAERRPYSDGATQRKSTSQVNKTQTKVSQNTSQLQKRVLQTQQRTTQTQQWMPTLQKVAGQLYTRTSSNSGSTWGDWSSTTTCTEDSSGSSRRQCIVGQLETRTSSNSGSSWTAWSTTGSCSTDSSSSSRRQCRITQNWENVGACTPTRTGSSGSYIYSGGSAAIDCQSASAWQNVAICSDVPANCQTTDTGWFDVASCSASSSGGQTITCQTTDTGWVGAASCTAGTSGGATTTCQTNTTGPTVVASCTDASATSGNSYTQTTCATATIMAATPVASCTAEAASASNSYVTTTCNTVTTGPTEVGSCIEETASAANAYTTTTCATGTGGVSNTLADVAEYYYRTDLRTSSLSNCTGVVVPPASTGNDVCANDVPSSAEDNRSTQHMTTFTFGLGASGYMQYEDRYSAANEGDYYSVKQGLTTDASSGVCSWQSSGVCNWPTPSSGSQTNIDDLWHAAVNGRGTYFSAGDPATLASGLNNALAGVSGRLGASAAATTSNPNVTSGDNFVFSSSFFTVEWFGEIIRQQISLTTGVVSPVIDWSAQQKLDEATSRTIYTYAPAATNKLKPFTWASLTAEASYFQTPHIATLSQFCASGSSCLSSENQGKAQGSTLVDFLRGDRSNEGDSTDIGKYFRRRTHVLGDIVNAEAAYVKKSLFEYADRGYSTKPAEATYTVFKSQNNSRQGMVYAAANDGMLHAFYSEDGTGSIVGGNEAWAYVPSFVIPSLYKLADKNYSNQHSFYVDGTPIAADICTANCGTASTGDPIWKTILVGGLNNGGRGYYALDITDPASPKALWEFTDDNLGYTYGNPEIAKLADGTWVVMFASGYNNVSPGDGVGRLFIVNANTGALIRTISTGVGGTGVDVDKPPPSGLAKIRAWADNTMTDNTALRVYGGDLLGNLWRFDINDTIAPAGYEAQRLVTLYSDAAGKVSQPITTRPELGLVGSYPVVFVGTGSFLDTPDLNDTSQQTFYAVKDNLDSTAFNNPRASTSNFVRQTLTTGTCPPAAVTSKICSEGQSVRLSSSNTVNFAANNGWYIDLPDSGERSNVDASLALGTLSFNTNVPNTSACTAGGYSYTNMLDYRTGASVSTAYGVGSRKLGNALATRGVLVRLPNNTVVQITRLSDGSTVTTSVPVGAGAGTTRRVSWRELVREQ